MPALIASALNGQVARAGDVVARFGGEEFAVLLPNTPLEGARCVAEAIRTAIYDLAIIHPTARFGRVTVSVGCAAIVPRVDRSWQQLVEQADRMLYAAKREGRNRVCVATEQLQGLPATLRVVRQP